MTMARLAIFLLGSFLATAALAQQQPPTPQETIERTIGNLFVANTNLQAQLAAAQAQIADLKKQLDEAKKAKPE